MGGAVAYSMGMGRGLAQILDGWATVHLAPPIEFLAMKWSNMTNLKRKS